MLKPISLCLLFLPLAAVAVAEPPTVAYLFPAGGQRGTKVQFRVGGLFLHDHTMWEMSGLGVTAASEIRRTPTTWFEGPQIKQPASQQGEDYPQDYAAEVQIAADAPLGPRQCRAWNAQGITTPVPFLVGDLPEVVEQEVDGEPLPTQVALNTTINGRIFPREDVDIWTFDVAAGQSITCAVAAAEFGSPLKSRLEIRGPVGQPVIAATGAGNRDPWVRFVAPAAGRYAAHIQDVQGGGLQHDVYRLTITAGPWLDDVYPLGGRRGTDLELSISGQAIDGNRLPVHIPDVGPRIIRTAFDYQGRPLNRLLFDVDDLPEKLESEPNDAPDQAASIVLPVVANGRIEKPGDVDVWAVMLKKGEAVQLEVRAARLGSPLLGVLAVRDEQGKELAQADGLSSVTQDAALLFTAPADGRFLVVLRERFAGRGGADWCYRLRMAAPPTIPELELVMPDSLILESESTKNLEVEIRRVGTWKSPLTLRIEGLPAGVTADEVQVPESAAKGTLVLKAGKNLAVQFRQARVIGVTELAGQPVRRVAHTLAAASEAPQEEIRVLAALKSPFKFVGEYDLRFVARGAVLRKRFQLDRGGYAGPLEVRLADRQGRHLQGARGPTLTIPAGATEFEYPLQLASGMELARTCRANLMLTGELADGSGAVHPVSFTTREQNEQLVALISPSPLRIAASRPAAAISPGGVHLIPVTIKRDRGVTGPVRLELIIPAHVRDLSAAVVDVPAGADTAEIRLQSGLSPGPFNAPLTLRATTVLSGDPLIAEAPLECFPVR